MRLKKIMLVSALAMFSTLTFAQTADEIVNKHIEALGGIEKLESIKSIVSERTMSMGGMEIPSKSIVVTGKSMRNESTVMGNTMVQVIHDGKGWMVRPAMMGGTGEAEDMPMEMFNQQIGQLDPFGALVKYQEKGNKVTLVGTEKIDKKDNYHLKIEIPSGIVINEYIDSKTFMVSKITIPSEGPVTEITFEDYIAKSGVKFPNTMSISSQMGQITMYTEKIEVNPEIDPKIFEKPTK